MLQWAYCTVETLVGKQSKHRIKSFVTLLCCRFFLLKIRNTYIKEAEETKENKSTAPKEEIKWLWLWKKMAVIILVVLCLCWNCYCHFIPTFWLYQRCAKRRWCFMKPNGCDFSPKMATLGIMEVQPLFRAYLTMVLLIFLGLLIWKVYKFYCDMWEIEKLATFNWYKW